MTRTYQVTGIILKGMPLGEADRLVTILSPEVGLIRAVAPGARKHLSPLRGRSDLLVVNQLLIAKGKTLDKITQADTLKTYPGLSRDLGKLAGSQYLAELVLCLALSEQPQSDLYELFTGHLSRLETLSHPHSLHSYLAQGVFHLLAISGIVPQVHRCCLTQAILSADFTDSQWRVGFSFDAGGLINLSAQTAIAASVNISSADNRQSSPFKVNNKLGAVELTLLQHLGNYSLPEVAQILPQDALNSSLDVAWMRVERLLRDYAEYHLDRSFRAAILVDSLSSVDF